MTTPTKQPTGTTELIVELKLTVPHDCDDISKAYTQATKGKPTDWLNPTGEHIKINKASVTKVTAIKVE